MQWSPKIDELSLRDTLGKMKAMLTRQVKGRRLVIWLTCLLCAFESITKGWASLALFPLSIVALPLFVFLEMKAIKYAERRFGNRITQLAWALLVSTLVLYIFTVGFGDTNIVYLFGVYATADTSSVAELSSLISQLSYYVTPIIGLALIGFLIASRRAIEDKN